ncbi:MAG: hypothetical protein EPN91_05660 [Salinibacterium sp.]|nr:MAG: hypothetical protein EPN91_05660 [Salinibacterium sp.]
MKMFRLLTAALAAAFIVAAAPVQAAQVYMCSPDVAGGVQGPRTWGGTLSPVPSGTIYVLNGQGCGLIAQGDVGYFASQGFTQASSQQSFLFTTGVATGTTDFVIGSVPAGAYIQQIIYSNAVAAAVTGGISIGTTANGTDVVAAQAVGSSALTFTTDALLLKRVFSTTAATPLHAAAVTAWNSTNVTITVVYGYF